MRLVNFIYLVAMASAVFLFSCEEKEDPYFGDLLPKCEEAFADAGFGAYLEECGGCDLSFREFNEMCFRHSTSDFLLFEWPDGCWEGTEVLLQIRGEANIVDADFYFSSPPKRRLVEDKFTATINGEEYVIPVNLNEPAIIDSCMESKLLSPAIRFDKRAFENREYFDEIPARFSWFDTNGQQFKESAVTLYRQELLDTRNRYDE